MKYNRVTMEPSNFGFDFDQLVRNMKKFGFEHIGNLVFDYHGTTTDYNNDWFVRYTNEAVNQSEDLGLTINLLFEFKSPKNPETNKL